MSFCITRTEWAKYATLSNYESFDCIKRKKTWRNDAGKLLTMFFFLFIAKKNGHKLWVRTMLLWLQAEAVGREKPPTVLVFHAPGSVSASFLHPEGSAKDGIIKSVQLWSGWVCLNWGCWDHFPATATHFLLDADGLGCTQSVWYPLISTGQKLRHQGSDGVVPCPWFGLQHPGILCSSTALGISPQTPRSRKILTLWIVKLPAW